MDREDGRGAFWSVEGPAGWEVRGRLLASALGYEGARLSRAGAPRSPHCSRPARRPAVRPASGSTRCWRWAREQTRYVEEPRRWHGAGRAVARGGASLRIGWLTSAGATAK